MKRVGIVPAQVGAENLSSFDALNPWPLQGFDSLLAFENVTFYDLTRGTGRKLVMDHPPKLQTLECSGESPSPTESALAIAELD